MLLHNGNLKAEKYSHISFVLLLAVGYEQHQDLKLNSGFITRIIAHLKVQYLSYTCYLDSF